MSDGLPLNERIKLAQKSGAPNEDKITPLHEPETKKPESETDTPSKHKYLPIEGERHIALSAVLPESLVLAFMQYVDDNKAAARQQRGQKVTKNSELTDIVKRSMIARGYYGVKK